MLWIKKRLLIFKNENEKKNKFQTKAIKEYDLGAKNF